MTLTEILSKGWDALHSAGVKRSLSLRGTDPVVSFDVTIQAAKGSEGEDKDFDYTKGDDRECAVMILKSDIAAEGVTIKEGNTFEDASGFFYDVSKDLSQPHEIFDRFICRIYRDG